MPEVQKSSSMTNEEAFGKFAWILVVLFFIGALFQAFSNVMQQFEAVSVGGLILALVGPYLPFLYGVAFVVSAVSIVLIVHSRHHIERIIKEERAKLYPADDSVTPFLGMQETIPANPRWKRIEDHMASDSSGEWRMAILEADIMLEEMLEAMGYRGEGIGERLKQIEKSDFNTLDKAWEAHKVRNQIAHEGADFHLTEREARRIIALYRDVFEEFRYI